MILFNFVILSCVAICSAFEFDYGAEFTRERVFVLCEAMQEHSPECAEQCKAYVELLKLPIENSWAWQMADSSAKINSGLLRGNMIDIGNLDECLAIDVTHNNIEIKGKYCYAALNIPFNVTNLEESFFRVAPIYSMALCIPHNCSPKDMLGSYPAVDYCQTAETNAELDGGGWAFVGVLIAVLTISLASSVYDYYLRCANKKATHPICLSFSLYTNGEKIFSISNNPDQMSCIHGLRSMSMLWIVTGHRFSGSGGSPIINILDADEWTKEVYSAYIMGAPMAVDTFFFLAGLLIAYSFMNSQTKPNARFNLFLFYLHRYLRLTPALAMVYFMYTTVLKNLTKGPMWPTLMDLEAQRCKEYWYSTFLYIQNIVNPDNLCLPHTWYLSVDMQIFLLAPVVLIPMVKFVKYAGHGLVGLILMSIIPPALITALMDITVLLTRFFYRTSQDYNRHYYVQIYNRIGPWFVGLLLGYIFYKTKDKKIKIHRAVNLIMWIITLVVMLIVIYLVNKMNFENDVSVIAAFHALHRQVWALCLMWIVFSCQNGHGGIINWFLSTPIFQVIGRISYSMYLLHMPIQMQAIYRKRAPQYFDDFELLNQAFGDILLVSFVSLFWSLLFESPMVIIEKILFGHPTKSDTTDKKVKADELPEKSIDAQNANGSIIETP